MLSYTNAIHMASASEAEQVVREFYNQLDEKGSVNRDMMAPDFKAEMAGMGELDAEGYANLAPVFSAAFPDLTHTVVDTVATDEGLGIVFRLKGTHKGEFNGVPATGKSISVLAIGVYHVRNGKIAKMTGILDMLSVMQQIGAIPTAEASA